MDLKSIVASKDKKYRQSFLKKYYAKSDGKTIDEHIQDLAENRKLFEKYYPELFNEQVSNLLKLAIYFHDFGKLNHRFQCKLPLPKGKKPKFCRRKVSDDRIPHNFLSPLFLMDIEDQMSDEDLMALCYSIVNHHKRGNHYITGGFRGICWLKEDLELYWDEFELPLDSENKTINSYLRFIEKIVDNFGNIKALNKAIVEKKDNIDLIIKIAGLLIRIDHASSGEIRVEQKPISENREKLFKASANTDSLRPFQSEFKNKENLVIVADTGLGKTGLSVVWSKRKQFYVLPNRTSTNAMFKTLSQVYKENNVGLLHSTGLLYLYDLYKKNNQNDESTIKEYNFTKSLAKPITITTADQLFTAVFKYPCYEKIYATLSYCDIIIDEIQGFSPQQIVPILRQIEETVNLGAKYLITTATLPGIVKNKFEKMGFTVETNHPTTFDKTLRHKVKIEKEKTIFDFSEQILNCEKNVLVIVNNVSTAQELYQKLIDCKSERDINLLHSRFILKERQDKEEAIEKPKNNSIWVTTQLVEASLDINYDILFTEIATADSLIQRMGRVWRHQKQDYDGDYNIYIAAVVSEKKVKNIYEKVLRDNTLKFIESALDKESFLLSDSKREIVDKLYSENFLKEINSRYLQEWQNIESIMNSGWTSFLKHDAQKQFRDVLTAEAIPKEFEKKVKQASGELNNLKNIKDKEERKKKRIEILNEISKLRLPVPMYWLAGKETKAYEVINRNYDILLLTDLFVYNKLGLCKDRDRVKLKKKKDNNNFLC